MKGALNNTPAKTCCRERITGTLRFGCASNLRDDNQQSFAFLAAGWLAVLNAMKFEMRHAALTAHFKDS